MNMRWAARFRAEHYRDMAENLRSLADIEPLASLRRHLRRLAAQHDEVAARLERPQARERDGAGTAGQPYRDQGSSA
jgi:hypothetical protein